MNVTDIFRKLLLLIIIIVLSKYNILAGLVGVFIYIYFFENKLREGMLNHSVINNNTMSSINNRNNNRKNYGTTQQDNITSSSPNNPGDDRKNYDRKQQDTEEKTQQNVSGQTIQKNVDWTYFQAKMNEEDKKQKTNKNINSSSEFRRNYCINNKLIKDNKPVIDVHESFPQLVYKSDPCDPCDNNCDFDIVSTNEGLTVSENLRGIDSNLVSVNR